MSRVTTLFDRARVLLVTQTHLYQRFSNGHTSTATTTTTHFCASVLENTKVTSTFQCLSVFPSVNMRTPSRDILSVAATAAISACALTYYIMINQRRKQKEDPKHDNSSQIAACTATRTTSCDAVAVPLVGLGEAHPASLLPENRQCVYLDYNATTPVFPEVTNVIIPFITTCFGNPSSPHVYAAVCRRAIELSRDQVGRLINAPNPHKTIYFTSCGSESDNRAIDIALHHYHKRRTPTPRIITCAVEHPGTEVLIILTLSHTARWSHSMSDCNLIRVMSVYNLFSPFMQTSKCSKTLLLCPIL